MFAELYVVMFVVISLRKLSDASRVYIFDIRMRNFYSVSRAEREKRSVSRTRTVGRVYIAITHAPSVNT